MIKRTEMIDRIVVGLRRVSNDEYVTREKKSDARVDVSQKKYCEVDQTATLEERSRTHAWLGSRATIVTRVNNKSLVTCTPVDCVFVCILYG